MIGRDETGRQRWVRYVASPDAKGRWTVAGVPAGTYTLTAFREGYEPGSESFYVRGTDVAKVTVVLSPRR